ncbi:LLM class flavin-dependent oxidoreductase [Saxibacter everestensis]|uniref:LLM class flavin-dependent oxidoreductase n=1 Tax=Saxibacter everestensis TaxID=2909229 RepID=A0ABY8QWW8_9MICO|nr:LLM class flavin-dependent oxidoreductase [Brevibacteriaceae bacterium ZFBP1038]
MRFGIVILPQDRWADAAKKWQRAESLGFDHAWTYDHLSWRSLAGEPWHATVPTLTAAAMVTSTISLGTWVASPNFRHPVTFAKELATLDDIAQGRITLGVGSGGTGFDAHVLGQPDLSPRERHERFTEFVEGLDVLLRHEGVGGPISFEGQWFTAREARMVGEPVQRPRLPFLIAANGPKGLRLVARHGQGWVTTGRSAESLEGWWDGVAELRRRLDDTLDAAGRDPGTIRRCLSLDAAPRYSLDSIEAFRDAYGRADELGFSDIVSHWPRAEGIYAGDERILDDIAADLADRHRQKSELE